MEHDAKLAELATHRRCVERLEAKWHEFIARRREWMVQQERHGTAAEKVAENILQDLFTQVLDWHVEDLNNQIRYSDLLLTRLGIRYLLLELKRPGALTLNQRAIESALDQARRYAEEQKVRCIGVSDGKTLYAADIVHGGLRPRIFVNLDAPEPPRDLWWLSVHGIYRDVPHPDIAIPEASLSSTGAQVECEAEALDLHPKYKIPAHCFGYVGSAGDHATWKLPFLQRDGTVDAKRLPKAIGAILSNYRGVKVSGIPEKAIPDVLVRLANAACDIGKLPRPPAEPTNVYGQLANILDQLGRVDDVKWR